MSVKTNSATDAEYIPELTGKMRTSVTPRAFAVGLTAGLLLCAVGPYNDYFIGATYLSGNFFPIAGVAALLVLTMVVNPIMIACKLRRLTFSPSEIITIWTMIVIVAGIPSSGMMRYLIPHIVAPHYYSSPTNGWETLIVSHLPQRLIVTDSDAIKWFFEGLPRGQSLPWAAWIQPLGWWSLFAGLMYVVFFSISGIVRKQWVENDHLTFPLVKLPVMLAEAPEEGRSLPAILRSPYLWGAVVLCTVLHTVKGMHLFYPTIPDIPTSFDSYKFITSPPLSYINNVTFAVFPLVIGFSYLLSTEVCFSLWLFYVVAKFQTMIASVYAWDIKGTGAGICMGPSFEGYQEAGAAIMVAIWIVWSMRQHIKEAFAKAFRNGTMEDSNEPLRYKSAFIGLAVGYVGLYVWLIAIASVQPLMALGVLGGSFVVFLVIAWLVAQAGLLFAQVAFAPSQLTTVLSPTGSFGPSSLLMGSLVEHVGWYDSREIMLPSIMNSEKAASSVALSQRSLTKTLVVTVALAFIVSAASSIWLPYTHGGGTALSDHWGYVDAPQLAFKWAASELHPHGAPVQGILANLAGGALFVLTLMTMRSYVASFPIHPSGFLVAATYPMSMLWFSLLLGWLIKVPIMRYAGIKGYQRFMPFFLGLILGDCMNAVLWTIIGLISHTGYRLLPS